MKRSGAKNIHCEPLVQKLSMAPHYQPSKEITFSEIDNTCKAPYSSPSTLVGSEQLLVSSQNSQSGI